MATGVRPQHTPEEVGGSVGGGGCIYGKQVESTCGDMGIRTWVAPEAVFVRLWRAYCAMRNDAEEGKSAYWNGT